jgi:hypothetical protein
MGAAPSKKAIPGGVVHELPADLRKALAADAKALATWEARNQSWIWRSMRNT